MKKLKILGLSFLTSLIVYFDFQFAFLPIWALFVSVFILYYGTTYWILESDIDQSGWFTLLLFPSLFMACIAEALNLYTHPLIHDFHVSIKGESLVIFLFYFFIFTIIGYLIILTMNIFNVSRYKRLPLLQAAQSILYVCTSIGGYVAYNLAFNSFSNHWSVFLILTIIISSFLIFINNWGLKIVGKESGVLILIGMYIIGQIGFVLLLFPLQSYIIPLTTSIALYIFNGMIIRMKKHKHMKASWVEYLTLTILMLILILYTSHWGIAGNILGY